MHPTLRRVPGGRALHGDLFEMAAAYVDLYLKEEILDEGLTRRLPVFATFLRAAAIGDTEVTNFSNIGRECGVASWTVRGYFEILEDTLVGPLVPAFTRRAKRRVQQAPKFYFRDVGVVNHLVGRHKVALGTEIFGKPFEKWVFHELSVYARTTARPFEIAYWRLSSGIEVDFVLGDAETAMEVKGKERLQNRDTRHFDVFRAEHPDVRRRIVVCAEPRQRLTDTGIRVLPYRDFVAALWGGEVV